MICKSKTATLTLRGDKKIMAKPIKLFRVLRDIGEVDGLQSYLMISKDGECWQVFRPKNDLETPWTKGHEVITTLRVLQAVKNGHKKMSPEWEEHGCEKAFDYILRDPFETVTEAWGEEIAKKNFSPEDFKVAPRLLKVDVKITEDMFVPSTWEDADTKAELANDLIRFLINDFTPRLYKRSLHKRLTGMFGYVRMDHEKFFDEHFTTSERKMEFLKNIANFVVTTDPKFSYADVEKFVRNYVIHRILPRWTKTSTRAEAVRDRAILLELLKKYGIPEGYELLK